MGERKTRMRKKYGMREEDNRPRTPRSLSHGLLPETKGSQDRWKMLGRS